MKNGNEQNQLPLPKQKKRLSRVLERAASVVSFRDRNDQIYQIELTEKSKSVPQLSVVKSDKPVQIFKDKDLVYADFRGKDLENAVIEPNNFHGQYRMIISKQTNLRNALIKNIHNLHIIFVVDKKSNFYDEGEKFFSRSESGRAGNININTLQLNQNFTFINQKYFSKAEKMLPKKADKTYKKFDDFIYKKGICLLEKLDMQTIQKWADSTKIEINQEPEDPRIAGLVTPDKKAAKELLNCPTPNKIEMLDLGFNLDGIDGYDQNSGVILGKKRTKNEEQYTDGNIEGPKLRITPSQRRETLNRSKSQRWEGRY